MAKCGGLMIDRMAIQLAPSEREGLPLSSLGYSLWEERHSLRFLAPLWHKY